MFENERFATRTDVMWEKVRREVYCAVCVLCHAAYVCVLCDVCGDVCGNPAAFYSLLRPPTAWTNPHSIIIGQLEKDINSTKGNVRKYVNRLF